jgi:hypothetical protein
MGAPSGSTAGVLQLARYDWIVGGVGQHREPLLHQDLRRHQQLLVVGEQRPRVADDLELHQVAHPQLARQPAGAHCVVGGEAASGVRQQRDLRAVDPVQQRLFAFGRQVEPSHRHGDHLGATGLDGALHGREVGVLARAHEQP